MLRITAVAICLLAMAGAAPANAEPLTRPSKSTCHTHACWQRVHNRRVNVYIERKIDSITPFGPCWGGRWAVPCNVIGSESKGSWSALNTWTFGTPCSRRACGPYQFLGWRVPWPVVTLRQKLMHHREAKMLWAQQMAGRACHWC